MKHPYRTTLTRRRFTALAAASATGALLGCTPDPASLGAFEPTGDSGEPSAQESAPATPAESADAATTPAESPDTSPAPAESVANETPDSEDAPVVYLTHDISAQGLMSAFDALEARPVGNVAVKLSTGEPGSNYLRPELVGDLVRSLSATIVECNTAYGGQRSSTEQHRQVAADHGFTAIANVDIMDADGEITLPVEGGAHLVENYAGANLANYDSCVSLAHFKGHAMGGFGGAIKNCSIGIASASGKLHIHSAGASRTSWGEGTQDGFLESMAEAAKAVADFLGPENMFYVNVMNRLSVDCDCDGHPAEPDMADIGILASIDPVALDRACVDLVYAADDGASVIERIESRNGTHTLDHAAAIGLGSLAYRLVSID